VTANVCIAYGDLINAEMIPGADIFPESVASASTAYSTAGTAVTEKGAAVLTQWQGLGAVYSAPESGELLAVMDPVGVDTSTIGTTLTSVSGIISNFADAVAPIKTRLLALKEEAATFAAGVINGVTVDVWDKDHPAWDAGIFSFVVTDFADMGPATIPWDQHRDTVEKNKDIIGRVNVEVAALDAAQAEAVNAINALRTDVCLAEVVPLTVEDLDAEGMVLPYGTASDGDKGCWQSTNDGMESAIVGMGEGAGALFGYNAATGDWGDGDTAAAAWRGMGMTVAGVAMLGGWGLAATLIPDEHVPDWLQGVDDFSEEAMGYATEAGKALVAVDMWSENPAEAFGTTLVNVGTFFIPGGAVVGGLKAGTVAARAASIAGHAADFVLPGLSVASRTVTGAAVHASSGLSALTNTLKGSLTTGVSAGRGALAQTLNSLGDSMPSVRVEPGYSTALPGGGVLPTGPGRIVIGEPGSGGDFLHNLADKVDPGTTPGTSGAASSTTSVLDTNPTAATPDGSAPAGSGTSSGGGGGASSSTPLDLENGSTHTPVLSNSDLAALGHEGFGQSLPDVLTTHGVAAADFTRMVETPVADLTRTEMAQLIDIRADLPSPHTADLLQKTIPYEAAEQIIHQMPDQMQVAGGFVARPVDSVGLTTQQIHDGLGLNYPESSFTADLAAGRPYFDVRFDATGVNTSYVPDSSLRFIHDQVPDTVLNITDPVARADAIQSHWDGLSIDDKKIMENQYPSIGRDLPKALALNTENPFRGNGFSGFGSGYAPEATLGGSKVTLPDGAELWRTLPDGTREFVAVLQRPDPAAPGSWVLLDVNDPTVALNGPAVSPTTSAAP
jgi:hypothetical protein